MRSIWWAAILAIVLIAGGCWWLTRGHARHNVAPALPIFAQDNDLSTHLGRVHIRGISKGKVVWDIDADNCDFTQDRSIQRLSGIKRVAVLNDGKAELFVSADMLERNLYTNDINLNGKVTLTGQDVLLHAPCVNWCALSEMLLFPQQFSAQVGDYTVTTHGGVTYDVKAGLLRCNGDLFMAAQGNTLHAGSALFDIHQKNFTLFNPVCAQFDVADIDNWSQGKNLPAIPKIPAVILQRYQKHVANHR